ncbi:HIT-like domain-containing protein [Chaetomium strumarium]|uniref:Bis(5'-adenosyl)-triphosphatase n=1 Tax=Chaetomium strumarium TaxID=1170767 RepID=A0AAJ0GVU4_9PEZI|nr:HIT-like domain-containing protein [Chaetomium strumarium]
MTTTRISRTKLLNLFCLTKSTRQAVRMSSVSSIGNAPPAQEPIYFGPFDVTNQVFLTTAHSFALVNLKPLLPGHVLVCPLAPHRRLTDLSLPELTDLFLAVQRVQRMLARHYFLPSSSSTPDGTTSTSATPTLPGPGDRGLEPEPELGSFNLALQDGPEAGQTVPHVHVHVIPRIRGTTAKPPSTPSDAVYEQMAAEEGNVGGALWDRDLMRERPQPGGSFPRVEDADRVARSMEEMEAEARVYRGVLAALEREEKERGGKRT